MLQSILQERGITDLKGRRSKRVALDLRGLVGREDIFRVSIGSKRDPAVEAWLNDPMVELRALARPWFARMRDCGDDVRELMHDGCPVACIEDAPFAYVNTFKNHVNVGFFNGVALEDPERLLEGSGRRMRHVKLTTDREQNVAGLARLIDAAYADIKERLA